MAPLLDELRVKKMERLKQLIEIRSQIEKISGEISGYTHMNDSPACPADVEELDLSLRKLGDYQAQLRALQKEKVFNTYPSIFCSSQANIYKVNF